MHKHVRLVTALTAVLALSTGGVAVVTDTSQAGTAAPTGQPPGTAGPSASTSSVTLVTGDRVLVDQLPNGHTSITFFHGPGRERIGFVKMGGNRQPITVVPDDAAPLLAAGMLDPRLFDVTGLIEQHLDSRHIREVPLILTYADGVSAATAPRPPTAQRVRTLAAVNGVALRTPSQDATATWAWLTGRDSGPARLAHGISKVWLDGRARPRDDESNAQIGVPDAWKAGYNGKGVTVGILDTGYDPKHPDLADAVVEARDFIDDGGPADRNGHGTHTATTIVGRGTASAGKYAGVAPGAQLLVGKVCTGVYYVFCDESAIIEGMHWLAGRTKVVSVSLGSDSDDGNDLMSQTVNKLSAQTGTLFVCAAGNDGTRWPGEVDAPAVADAALAVGSVTKKDTISDFSSAGPRKADGVVKPDIAAPGEAIVAGRADGTLNDVPVGRYYARLSGTSMATAHVSGSAAILLQKHPDWTGAQLKSALTSSAAPVPGAGSVFRSGAGRVDVASAIRQTVFTDGAVSFGQVPWPRPAEPVRKTITYRNDGDTPVTLSQKFEVTDGAGKPAPDGLLTLEPASVTVPAHGTATVTLIADPAKAPSPGGAFGGRVIATGDGVRVSTAVGLPVQPEQYALTVKLVDRTGSPPTSDPEFGRVPVALVNADNGDYKSSYIADGIGAFRLAKGNWRVLAWIPTPGPDGGRTLANASVLLDQDRSLVMDARQGKLLSVSAVDRPDAQPKWFNLALWVVAQNGDRLGATIGAWGGTPVYLVADRKGAERDLTFVTKTQLGPAGGPDAYRYHLVLPTKGAIPDNPTYSVRDAELARVNQRYLARGKDTVAEHGAGGDIVGDEQPMGIASPISLPLERVEYYTPEPARWTTFLIDQRLPEQKGDDDGMVREFMVPHRLGPPQTRVWNSAVFGPELQQPENMDERAVPARTGPVIQDVPFDFGMPSRTGNFIHGTVDIEAPGEPGHGGWPDSYLVDEMTGSTVVYQGDKVLGEFGEPVWLRAVAPEERARIGIRLIANSERTWSELNKRLEVRWEFDSAYTEKKTRLPLMDVRVLGQFDAYNRAPAGAQFPLALTVKHAKGSPTTAKVTDVSLEASFDDGQTWQSVKVTGEGSDWQAQVQNAPAGTGTGFASLRIKARDSDSGTLEQTVIRAYKLTS